jgi:hypothetical protein
MNSQRSLRGAGANYVQQSSSRPFQAPRHSVERDRCQPHRRMDPHYGRTRALGDTSMSAIRSAYAGSADISRRRWKVPSVPEADMAPISAGSSSREWLDPAEKFPDQIDNKRLVLAMRSAGTCRQSSKMRSAGQMEAGEQRLSLGLGFVLVFLCFLRLVLWPRLLHRLQLAAKGADLAHIGG